METEIGIPWDGQILSVSYLELGDPGIPHAVLELPEWDTMPDDELRSLGADVTRIAAASPTCVFGGRDVIAKSNAGFTVVDLFG